MDAHLLLDTQQGGLCNQNFQQHVETGCIVITKPICLWRRIGRDLLPLILDELLLVSTSILVRDLVPVRGHKRNDTSRALSNEEREDAKGLRGVKADLALVDVVHVEYTPYFPSGAEISG